MKTVNDAKLMQVVSRSIQDPTFPKDEFAELIHQIHDTADHVTETIVLALVVFEETKRFLQFKFAGKRVMTKRQGIARCVNAYLV